MKILTRKHWLLLAASFVAVSAVAGPTPRSINPSVLSILRRAARETDNLRPCRIGVRAVVRIHGRASTIAHYDVTFNDPDHYVITGPDDGRGFTTKYRLGSSITFYNKNRNTYRDDVNPEHGPVEIPSIGGTLQTIRGIITVAEADARGLARLRLIRIRRTSCDGEPAYMLDCPGVRPEPYARSPLQEWVSLWFSRKSGLLLRADRSTADPRDSNSRTAHYTMHRGPYALKTFRFVPPRGATRT